MKTIREHTLEALLVIADNLDNGVIINSGICNQMTRYLKYHKILGYADQTSAINLLETIYERWDKYSGNPFYPVPSPTGDPSTAYAVALQARILWDTDFYYGRDRVELLRFLIKELQNEHT